VKLRNASGLTAAPIFRDEPVGAPVSVISHPNGRFYVFTQGYVSRYAIVGKRTVVNITADYAKGSSGGPFFNSRGDLVGLVASTTSLAASRTPIVVGDDGVLRATRHKPTPKESEKEDPGEENPGQKPETAAGQEDPDKDEPVKKPAAEETAKSQNEPMVLENGHQMTLKNGVPSREILNLIE